MDYKLPDLERSDTSAEAIAHETRATEDRRDALAWYGRGFNQGFLKGWKAGWRRAFVKIRQDFSVRGP